MKESEGLYRSFRFLKRALIGITLVLAALVAFGYTVFMRHVDAPEAWAAAERELRAGSLQYGEKVERWAKVYQRRPTDYFRGANGVLYATNDRIIFIGIAPTDKLENEDAPSVILSDEFPNDTVLTMEPKRIYFLTAHGVEIDYPGRVTAHYAAVKGENRALDDLVSHVNTRIRALRDTAARERALRQAVAALIAEPLSYTIRRGDALSLIGRRFDTDADQLKKWNNLQTDRVRVGDKLVVKPAGDKRTPATKPAATPAAKPAAKPAAGNPPSRP